MSSGPAHHARPASSLQQPSLPPLAWPTTCLQPALTTCSSPPLATPTCLSALQSHSLRTKQLPIAACIDDLHLGSALRPVHRAGPISNLQPVIKLPSASNTLPALQGTPSPNITKEYTVSFCFVWLYPLVSVQSVGIPRNISNTLSYTYF